MVQVEFYHAHLLLRCMLPFLTPDLSVGMQEALHSLANHPLYRILDRQLETSSDLDCVLQVLLPSHVLPKTCLHISFSVPDGHVLQSAGVHVLSTQTRGE